jgi:hypothetical protein
MTVKVYIIESEDVWSQKVDEVKEFLSLKEAEAFCREYNSENNLPTTPDWYMYATLV